MNGGMTIAADLPAASATVEGCEVGKRSGPGGAQNTALRNRRRMIGIGVDLAVVMQVAIENMILLAVMTHQEMDVLTTGIERPIVGEDAIEGSVDRTRMSALAKQQAGFFQSQFHGKGSKRE